MSKIYRTAPKSRRWGLIGGLALLCTATLFFVLPFFQLLGDIVRDLDRMARVDVSLPPPPPPPQEPPPPPEPDEPEERPELQDTPPPLTLAQLELALNPGTGGAGIDFGFDGFSSSLDVLGDMKIFDLRDLDRHPRPIFQSEPNYPYELRQAGVSGWVRVQFIVDSQGNVRQPRVDSSSHREFEQPAVDAVRNWRFEPGYKDGEAVNTRVLAPVNFSSRR